MMAREVRRIVKGGTYQEMLFEKNARGLDVDLHLRFEIVANLDVEEKSV
jgi:hypothetical protein